MELSMLSTKTDMGSCAASFVATPTTLYRITLFPVLFCS